MPINPDSIGSAKDFAKGATRVRSPGAKDLKRGGVAVATIQDCTLCGEKVLIGVGYVLRIKGPKANVKYCHEVVDLDDVADHYGNGPEARIVKTGGRR